MTGIEEDIVEEEERRVSGFNANQLFWHEAQSIHLQVTQRCQLALNE